MVMRQIIEIEHDKFSGCGVCVPDRPEGALQFMDGKAYLVRDIICERKLSKPPKKRSGW